jgi:hypothetical protein
VRFDALVQDRLLDRAVADALAAVGIETMSRVQAQALPALLRGEDAIAAAETGTGKTFVYAVPIVQRVREAEARAQAEAAAAPASAADPFAGVAPFRALVFVPGQELCLQVCAVLGILDPAAGALPIVAGMSVPPLEPGGRVLVATPGALLNWMRKALASSLKMVANAEAEAHDALAALAALDAQGQTGGADRDRLDRVVRGARKQTERALDRAEAFLRRLRGLEIAAFDEGDLVLGATHREDVEAALRFIGAAKAFRRPETVEARKQLLQTLAAPPAKTKASKSKAGMGQTDGIAASITADDSIAISVATDTAASTSPGRGAAPSPAGEDDLSLPRDMQFIVCAATLIDSLSSQTSQRANADSFGTWLYKHLRRAKLVKTEGLHRTTPGLRVNEITIDTKVLHQLADRAAARARLPDDSYHGAQGNADDRDARAIALAELVRDARVSALERALRMTLPENRDDALPARFSDTHRLPHTSADGAASLAAAPPVAHSLPFRLDAGRKSRYLGFEQSTGETVLSLLPDEAADRVFDEAGRRTSTRQTTANATEVALETVQAPVSVDPYEADTEDEENTPLPDTPPAKGAHGQVLVFMNSHGTAEEVLMLLEKRGKLAQPRFFLLFACVVHCIFLTNIIASPYCVKLSLLYHVYVQFQT